MKQNFPGPVAVDAEGGGAAGCGEGAEIGWALLWLKKRVIGMAGWNTVTAGGMQICLLLVPPTGLRSFVA